MSQAKPYSPRLEPDLIPVLYREGRRRKIPMTVLASGLIRAALRYEGVWDGVRAYYRQKSGAGLL